MQGPQQAIASEMPEPAPFSEQEGTMAVEVDELGYEKIPNEEDGDENRIDKDDDSDYTHAMVGRKIQMLYTNVVILGEITWYNTRIEECRISFNEDSDDNMGLKTSTGSKFFFFKRLRTFGKRDAKICCFVNQMFSLMLVYIFTIFIKISLSLSVTFVNTCFII